jgi:hypothetical protein
MLGALLALALAPVSVAGQEVSEAELTARVAAYQRPPAEQRFLERDVGDAAVEALWIQGEAARLGLQTDPGRVEEAVAREIRSFGDEENWRRWIQPDTPEQARARIAREVLRAGIAAALTRHADTPGLFAAAFEGFHARWRAVTRCTDRWRHPARDRCANKPHPRSACRWMGAAEVCRYSRGWMIVVDIIHLLYPEEFDADGSTAARGVRAVRREMGPASRRLDDDTDADSQLLYSRDRGPIVRAAQALERLVQRSAAGQAIR